MDPFQAPLYVSPEIQGLFGSLEEFSRYVDSLILRCASNGVCRGSSKLGGYYPHISRNLVSHVWEISHPVNLIKQNMHFHKVTD